MSNAFPPHSASGRALRQRLIVGLVGIGILVAAAWLALIVVSRIDELFFPGQGLSNLPALPGVQQGDGGVQGRINILVMGLDRRPSEGKLPTRTDTMFVVTVDSHTKTAGILGIPRDLWVEIPLKSGGYYEDRVNTAYVAGEQGGYSGGGAALAEHVVERNLGISIDHYVIIDFQGFIKVIDELGGVDVYVEQEVNDPLYSRTERPGDYYPLHFAVGMQHMDGQTALDYSRTRYGNSDLDRIKRQQQVIFAAIDKALQQRLIGTDKLLSLFRRYKDAIGTDINDLKAPGFASLAAQIDPTNIRALTLGYATTNWTTPDGRAVLLADKKLVREIVDAFLSDQQFTEEAARIEVQNAAGADGLASKVIHYLEGFGFSAGSLTSAVNAAGGSVRPLTEIVDFTGKEHTISRLASVLGVPPGQVRIAGPPDASLRNGTADIVVVLGADAQALDLTTEQPQG